MTRSTTLYRRVLGEVFDSLPPEIKGVHDLPEGGVARGRCHVRRGRCLFARWIATMLRFPSPGRNLPVTVRFEHRDSREVWRRDFAGHEMTSIQEPAKAGGRLVERFGPCAVELAVPAGPDGLRLEPRRMWLFGVPLPRFLLPQIQASERVLRGRFRFDVRIALPLLGLLVHYRAYLLPVTAVGEDGPARDE
ncbi:MAG: DUF4166 domain-containing protein [Alphaproteobacteria bacterium]|nr:DUF4166 domain-containing protein [Alphaproteobacteria bacterium]